jgi:hypothetical protein
MASKFGFGDLNFGENKEKVITYLKEKYSEENVTDSERYVWLNNFELGDKVVEVTFFFDNNDQLYSFQFQSDKVSADDFNYKLKDDVLYLSTVFINKFGKPSKKYKVNFFSVDSNSISYFGKWNNKDYDIYTGISSYEFQYYAVACVTSKKMAKTLELYNKKQNIKSSKKAVDSF